MADRGNHSIKVWRRFGGAPANDLGIVEWLKRAAPKVPTMFDFAEVWPGINEGEERKLQKALESLVDRPQDEVIQRVTALEQQHAGRRGYPWQKLGLSPLATALEPLAQLANLCTAAPGAPTPDAYAEYYARSGWRVDAAALATMAAHARRSSNMAQCLEPCAPSICRGSKTPPATCNSSSATMEIRFPSATNQSKPLRGGSYCLRTDCGWTLPSSWRTNWSLLVLNPSATGSGRPFRRSRPPLNPQHLLSQKLFRVKQATCSPRG